MPSTAFLPSHCQLLVRAVPGASALHNRTVTSLSACESQQSCAINLLYCKCQGSSVYGAWMVALDVFCFVYSVDFPGITKFCISPALGHRDALAVHLFAYKCFSLSNHEYRIYRIVQYQWKEHIHAWNTIILSQTPSKSRRAHRKRLYSVLVPLWKWQVQP